MECGLVVLLIFILHVNIQYHTRLAYPCMMYYHNGSNNKSKVLSTFCQRGINNIGENDALRNSSLYKGTY